MTTIIARPGLIIADTQYTTDNGCEYRTKLYKLSGGPVFNGGTWAGAGDMSIMPMLRKALQALPTPDQLAVALAKESNYGENIDASILCCLGNVVYYFDTSGATMRYTDWIAIGSGAKYANSYLSQENWAHNGGYESLGNMAMRASLHLDPYTGGKTEMRKIC